MRSSDWRQLRAADGWGATLATLAFGAALPYAHATGDGPWSRYLIDLMILTPVTLCFALGGGFRALSEEVLASVTPADIADQIKQRFASEDLLWVVLAQRGTSMPQVDESKLKEKADALLSTLKAATPQTLAGATASVIRPLKTLAPPKAEPRQTRPVTS